MSDYMKLKHFSMEKNRPQNKSQKSNDNQEEIFANPITEKGFFKM